MSDISPAFALRERQVLHAESIAGKSVVAGLHWERLDSSKGAKAAARDRGTRAGFNVACLWTAPAVPQVAFGAFEKGARPGAIALATLLAKAIGDDGIACVRLPSGQYAMAAVRDGIIQVGSDLAGSSDEIQLRFASKIDELADFGHAFARVLAPEEIYPAAERLDADTVFGPLRSKARGSDSVYATLFPLTRSADPGAGKRGRAIAALVAVALLAGGGYWVYQNHTADLRAKELADAAAKMRALIASQPPPAPPKPWVSQPSVPALLGSCSKEMAKLPVAIGGWMLDTATCGAGHMEASYEREGNATVADLLGALQVSLQIVPNIDAAGDKAGVSVGFSAPAASGEDLATADDASTSFMSHFQLLDVSAPLTLTPPPSVPPGQTPPPPPPWKVFTWSVQGTAVTAIDTRSYPSLLLSGLDIPGLRVDAISLLRTDAAPYLSWTVTGHLYAN